MEVKIWDGRPIGEPGWYANVPIEKYHAAGICIGPAVSSSNLRKCWSHSPAHMFAEWCENPDSEPRKPTRQMILGQAAHHLFLGEDGFSAKYVCQPETYPDKKTGEKKKWHNGSDYCKAWNEKFSDRVIYTVEEGEAIIAMAKSLELEPLVQDGLLRGHVETSGFFHDKETDLWVKVRPDVIPTDSGDFADLKTASEVITPALQYSIRTYGYHQQGALIWEACDALGQEFASFVLMFIETQRPHCARTAPLEENDLSLGRRQNRLMMRKIRECMEKNHFPGPGEGETRPMPLAKDERERIETRLKIEDV
jgi:PDDEXK-like domain of unknown function (DUF3799)